jgi:hypothetical protein
MIRDGILESEQVLSLPVEARWLYVSILLSADDVGLFEATPFRLARRADVRREHADKLLALLVDIDLVRLYRVDGKAYGFVPRYRQRLQITRLHCPPPPIALMDGDEDAINKINRLTSKPSVNHGEPPKTTDAHPPELELELELKVELSPTAKTVGPQRKRSAPTRGSRLPEDWALSKSCGEWAMKESGFSADRVRVEAAKFSNHWWAESGAKASKRDWVAAWRTWVLKAMTMPQQTQPRQQADVAGSTVPSSAAKSTAEYLARDTLTPDEIKAAAAKHREAVARVTGRAA